MRVTVSECSCAGSDRDPFGAVGLRKWLESLRQWGTSRYYPTACDTVPVLPLCSWAGNTAIAWCLMKASRSVTFPIGNVAGSGGSGANQSRTILFIWNSCRGMLNEHTRHSLVPSRHCGPDLDVSCQPKVSGALPLANSWQLKPSCIEARRFGPFGRGAKLCTFELQNRRHAPEF
jgi:hypothetical protein